MGVLSSASFSRRGRFICGNKGSPEIYYIENSGCREATYDDGFCTHVRNPLLRLVKWSSTSQIFLSHLSLSIIGQICGGRTASQAVPRHQGADARASTRGCCNKSQQPGAYIARAGKDSKLSLFCFRGASLGMHVFHRPRLPLP